MRVLVLDPGERIGWAKAYIELEPAEPCGLPAALDVTDHGVTYLKAAALRFDEEIRNGDYDVVVYETWQLTHKGARVLIGSDMQWCQFIGMIRLACWKAGVKCVGQPPAKMSSARRSLTGKHPSAPDVAQRVAKADAVTHDDGHDGSALLHLWTYFFDRYV